MDVLDVAAIDDGRAAQFVRLADAHARLDAAAGQPTREPVGVVVAAGARGVLGRRLPAELPGPDDDGRVEQPGPLQVLEQPGDRQVGVPGVLAVVGHHVGVGVPVVVVVRPAGVDLDEPDAALDEPAGEQALAAEVRRAGLRRAFDAVHFEGFLRLLGEIDGLGGVLLHLVREFVAGDAGHEFGVVRAALQVRLVLLLEPVEDVALLVPGHARRQGEVVDRRLVGADDDPLVRGRHEARGPVLRPRDRPAGLVEHDHEARHVLVDRAEAVGHPRAETRVPGQHAAGVHHEHRRAVDGAFGVHGVDEADVIDAGADVGEEVRDVLAALAVLLELPLRADDAALVLVPAPAEGLDGNRLAVEGVQGRLVVEGLDLAGAAVHEQEDDGLGLGRLHRRLGGHRVGEPRRRDFGGPGDGVAHHPGERRPGEPAAGLPEELAPRAAAELVRRDHREAPNSTRTV